MALHGHVCGLYYILPPPPDHQGRWYNQERRYLPRVSLAAHTQILSFSSRTTLKQTFVNPSQNEAIPKLRYTFPLYDGVSVVSFVCTINKTRVIRGVVQEREEAKRTYDAAVAQGQVAGLLDQLPDASDVFTTTLGNIPAGAEIAVEISYLGELKHDAEVDGIRFTIPTGIAPRYGSYPGEIADAPSTRSKGGIEIVVDAEMPTGSGIKSIQSPSHPISVTIGSTSTSAADSELSLQKASATLSLGTAELHDDFVLQVVATNTSNPVAILETHPTLPNQRALMATLVPKFNLPSSRPEIVFVCDRSGSMGDGNKIPNLKTALHVFLKSLPLGVKFNICSFGSSHSFLFDRSRSYDASSLAQATKHVDTFKADFGGTEMYKPLEDTFKRRFSDMDLEVFLLTDGQIWAQDTLTGMINNHVEESKGAVRVFTLGVGRDASHALIESVARAGNGFSQSVTDHEKMNNKVVRMLKAALSPHITDYTLEVKYGEDSASDADDGFEIVEKVMDALTLDVVEPKSQPSAEPNTLPTEKKAISLFDTSADPDVEMADATLDDCAGGKYSHVPAVTEPKLLQAPFVIPPLFSFTRTSVYLLLSAETAKKTPRAVVLRGTSKHGPLELEIPVTVLAEKGETIHQLAARKAVKELEEGRGWIYHAKDANDGKLFKEKHEGRFLDMVEREAVRLGVKFQVGGKWCSFVAVEKNNTSAAAKNKNQALDEELVESPGAECEEEDDQSDEVTLNGIDLFPQQDAISSQLMDVQSESLSVGPARAMRRARCARVSPASAITTKLAGSVARPMRAAYGAATAAFAPRPMIAQPSPAPFAPPSATLAKSSFSSTPTRKAKRAGGDHVQFSFATASISCEEEESELQTSSSDVLDSLVSLQTFTGAWVWDDALLGVLGLQSAQITAKAQQQNVAGDVGTDKLATALVLAYLKKQLAAREEEWEMLADKAVDWLNTKLQSGGVTVEAYLEVAKVFFD